MKYRKKPVEIEAMEWDGSFDSFLEIVRWAGPNLVNIREFDEDEDDHDHLVIRTLEGQMRAEPGDFIIRGVIGELYPCKPVVFRATYEETS